MRRWRRLVALSICWGLPVACSQRPPNFDDVVVADVQFGDSGDVVVADRIDVPVVDAVDAVDAGDATTLDAQDARPDSTDVTAETGDSPSMDVVADRVGDSADVATDVVTDAGPSGRCTPTIDGTIGTDWTASAVIERLTTTSAWGVTNQLRAIRVCYDPTNLYVAISGTVETTNGIVVYVDRDYGTVVGGRPVGVTDFATLTDETGPLDGCISAAYTLTPSLGFGAEAAFGMRGLLNAAMTGTDPSVGLRLISGTPTRASDFAWVSGMTSRCSMTGEVGCEISIDWTALFEGARPADARVALFARINNAAGDMSSNQTLPEDSAALPRTISRAIVLDVHP